MKKVVPILFIFLYALFCFSCQIGLGEEVDLEAPILNLKTMISGETEIDLSGYATKDDITIFNDIKKESEINMLYVANKSDNLTFEQCSYFDGLGCLLVSAKFNNGVDELLNKIKDEISKSFSSGSGALITRKRYREALLECLHNLNNFNLDKEIELSAEDIRLASRALGKITGR